MDCERHAEGARPDALDRCFPQPSERARKLARRCRLGRWLLRKGCGARSWGSGWWVITAPTGGWFSPGPRRGRIVGPAGLFQAPAAAVWCLWSFNRLWVAVISRHCERAADLPRRWKRSIRRLNLVFANTGSIIALRFR